MHADLGSVSVAGVGFLPMRRACWTPHEANSPVPVESVLRSSESETQTHRPLLLKCEQYFERRRDIFGHCFVIRSRRVNIIGTHAATQTLDLPDGFCPHSFLLDTSCDV